MPPRAIIAPTLLLLLAAALIGIVQLTARPAPSSGGGATSARARTALTADARRRGKGGAAPNADLAGGSRSATPQSVSSSGPPSSSDGSPDEQRGNRPALRVFVHVTEVAQVVAADRLRSALNGLSYDGRNVSTPPVRIVPRGPSRTEVRCLRRADCKAARLLGYDLHLRLGTPVRVVDMSGRYGRDPAVRPGSLELWLKPR